MGRYFYDHCWRDRERPRAVIERQVIEDYITSLESQLAERDRELAEAREDVGRLDCIENGLSSVHCNWTSPGDWSVTLHHADAEVYRTVKGDTLRAAIDYAKILDTAWRQEIEAAGIAEAGEGETDDRYERLIAWVQNEREQCYHEARLNKRENLSASWQAVAFGRVMKWAENHSGQAATPELDPTPEPEGCQCDGCRGVKYPDIQANPEIAHSDSTPEPESATQRVLRGWQWSLKDDQCPICWRREKDGHDGDCDWAAAIREQGEG